MWIWFSNTKRIKTQIINKYRHIQMYNWMKCEREAIMRDRVAKASSNSTSTTTNLSMPMLSIVSMMLMMMNRTKMTEVDERAMLSMIMLHSVDFRLATINKPEKSVFLVFSSLWKISKSKLLFYRNPAIELHRRDTEIAQTVINITQFTRQLTAVNLFKLRMTLNFKKRNTQRIF